MNPDDSRPDRVRSGLNRIKREVLLDRTVATRRRLQREHIFSSRRYISPSN